MACGQAPAVHWGTMSAKLGPRGGEGSDRPRREAAPRRWVASLDHRRLGTSALAGIAIVIIVGLGEALLLRAEQLGHRQDLIDEATYARTYTLHGVVMMLAVGVHAIPSTLGSYLLPLQLGARNLAFPRLNLVAFTLWLLGASGLLVGAQYGGADTGWTFLPPQSTTGGGAVGLVIVAVMALAGSAALRSLGFLVTLHFLRPTGKRWADTPVFCWSLYASAIVQLIAAPVLVLTLVLLLGERGLGTGVFDPAVGGDALLYEHFFWFAAHGLAYSAILPALGILAEIVPVFAGRRLFSRRSTLIGLVGLSLAALLAYGQHLPDSRGHSVLTHSFSRLWALVSLVPAAYLGLSWLGTLRRGRIRLEAPMLLALTSIISLLLGGLTGAFLATPSLAVHLSGTTFVTAHMHYLLIGGVLTGFLAGVHFWWPRMFGTLFQRRVAQAGSVLLFLGTQLLCGPLLAAGAQGLGRHLAVYPGNLQALNQASSAGSLVIGIALALLAFNLVWSLRKRRESGLNPWQASGLEWVGAPSS